MPALTLSPAEVDQALQLLGAALHAARPGAAIPARCPSFSAIATHCTESLSQTRRDSASVITGALGMP